MRPSVLSASKSGATSPIRRLIFPPVQKEQRTPTGRRCKDAGNAACRIQSMRLRDRSVIVTGGASGLGGATVDAIVAAGGRAVIVDINAEAGRAKGAQHGAHATFV